MTSTQPELKFIRVGSSEAPVGYCLRTAPDGTKTATKIQLRVPHRVRKL